MDQVLCDDRNRESRATSRAKRQIEMGLKGLDYPMSLLNGTVNIAGWRGLYELEQAH